MKTLSKILYVLLVVFLLFLIFGRFCQSLSGGMYVSDYPNRFTANTSAVLFLILPILLAALVIVIQRFLFNNCSRVKVIVLLSAFIVIKIILFAVFYTNVELAADFKTYYLVADALANGKIVMPNYIATFPHVFGYPSVLSIVFRIFGSSVKAGLFFNLLLSCGTIWIIYCIGRQLHNEKTGLIASALYVALPSSTMYCYLLCSEFLYQFVQLTVVLLFLCLLKVKDKFIFFGLAAINGILLAILSAIRPNGLILLIALIITVALFIRDYEVQISRKIIAPVLCGIFIVTYMFATAGINAYIENYIGTSLAKNRLGWNLFVGLNQESLGAWNSKDSELFGSLLAEKGAAEAQSELINMAVERLDQFDSLPETMSFLARKTLRMWSHDHEVYSYMEGEVTKVKPWWMKNPSINKIVKLGSDAVYYIIINIMVIGFVYMMIKNRRLNMPALIFVLFILGTIALHIPFEAAPRYHNPCLAPFCILAAYSVAASGAWGFAKTP